MPARVVNENEISINGFLYHLAAPVRRLDAAQQAGKVVIGEQLDESNPFTSTVSLTDPRGGIGILVNDPQKDVDRVWWATVQLRHKEHMVLPRLATTTAAGPAADVQVLAWFKAEVFATFGTAVHVYSSAADSWGNSVVTLNNNATDWAVGLLQPSGTTTETLVLATGSEVHYAPDSATWAVNTTNIKYMEFFNDLLWGIDQAGQLYYTDDLSAAWSLDAQLQLPDNYVTGLEVARGPDREQKLYAMTRVGLHVLNTETTRFVPTDHVLPFHPQGGDGFKVWRGSLMNSAGNAVYTFQAGADRTVIDVIGPDLDDGLPSDRRGTITQLLSSHNDLIALLDSTEGGGVSDLTTRSSGGLGSSRHSTFAAAGGESSLLGWDTRGWEVKWASGTTARAITAGVVAFAYNAYRIWWAHNQRVLHMELPVDVVNPTQISTLTYDTAGTLETSWFDAGVSNLTKLALSVFVDSTHPTTDETLKIEYATDLVESYTTVATKTATGQVEYFLPSSSSIIGVSFRYWKFRLTWARGNTNTRTPDLHKIFLVFRKTVDALWGTTISLDLSEPYNGVDSAKQLKNLEDARYTDTLIEVTWRDDDTDVQNYFMDMIQLQPIERSGREPNIGATCTLIEPRQSTSR